MDKIKVYQDVLNEGHYKLLSDNLESIKEDDLLLFNSISFSSHCDIGDASKSLIL